MVSLGIISIQAKYIVLYYAVCPVKNKDLFYQAWKGVEATWYAPMERWKTWPLSTENCPMCHLVIFFREDPAAKENLNLSTRTLIAKALSVNTDLFRNLTDKIQVIPLQDEAHHHCNIEINSGHMVS